MSSAAPASSSPGSSQAPAPSSSQGTSPSASSSFSASSPVSSADYSSTSYPVSSDSGQNTTSNSPSPTSTTTSPTPTTTSQSSAAQTTAAAQTTSPYSTPGASTSFGSTAEPETTSSSTFTSQVPTVVPSTNAAGSIVYVTTTVPDVIATAIGTNTTSSSSNTGVIVGAAVGGVAGIAILALLVFCLRRRARRDEFDGNFDPDRVVGHTDGGGTLPHVDLADEVTPFPQPYTDQDSSTMRQYSDSPYLGIPSPPAGSGKASTEYYPPGVVGAGNSFAAAQPRPFMQPGAGPPPSGAYLPPVSMYGTGPVDWHAPRPGVSPPPSTVSNTTASTRGAKEREAVGRSGQGAGLGLATQQEVAEGSEAVVVHQDAGRAPPEEPTPPREIPPAYDSIRQD